MERAAGLGLDCITPPAAGARGAHVSIVHQEGYAVIQALIARGVIGDFRAPDVMRFGFSPLFLSFAEVWRAFDILEDVLGSGSYRDPAYSTPAKVT
jgi:kynureninase